MPALRITLLLSLHRDLRDSVGNANRTINLNVLKRLRVIFNSSDTFMFQTVLLWLLPVAVGAPAHY